MPKKIDEYQSMIKKYAKFFSTSNIMIESEPIAEVFVEIKPTNWYGENFHSNDNRWDGVALPLVRRVFSNLMANDIVSVQPMSQPTGNLFYLDYKYNDGNDSNADNSKYTMGTDPYQSSTEIIQWKNTIMT